MFHLMVIPHDSFTVIKIQSSVEFVMENEWTWKKEQTFHMCIKLGAFIVITYITNSLNKELQ